VKILCKLALVLVLGSLAVGSVGAKQRKLRPGTYISSAKIEIIGYAETKEKARIELAQALLDSLFLYYGPHSEAYYWYSQIKWDLSQEKADLKERLAVVRQAVALADSLKWSCGNKKIDKDYRKDCEKFDEQMDSIRVAEWRDYYNTGHRQMKEIEDLKQAILVTSDSVLLEDSRRRLEAFVDSAQSNMEIAVAIDSVDARPFIGLATISERMGNFEKAIEYLKAALPHAEDRYQIVISIAYDYIQADDYDGAIPYFREYVDSMTSMEQVMQDPTNRAAVISTAQNLAICYNNAKEYDKAYGIFNLILSFDPEDTGALVGSARYQQHRGREAGDSARVAGEGGGETAANDWRNVRDQRFDSARVLLKQVFEIMNDDCGIAAEYGLMAAILQRYEEAKPAFARASELCPDDVDNWVSLGDCNIALQDFAGAAAAYEKVVELDPTSKAVWERLADLYRELRNPTRRAEILKKLESM